MTAIQFSLGRGHSRLQNIISYINDAVELSHNTLRVAVSVVDQETITIGSDVYEVTAVNQDSSDDAQGGDFNNTTNPLRVDMTSSEYARLAPIGGSDSLGLGDVIRVNSEFMRVDEIEGDSVLFSRGRGGSGIVVHADGADIFEQANLLGSPSRIPIPVISTLTPDLITDTFVWEVNNYGTEDVAASGVTNNYVLVSSKSPGVAALATTETLTGANSAWFTPTLEGGSGPKSRHVVAFSHVPSAVEVTEGQIRIPVNFAPEFAVVDVVVTASSAPLAWNGDVEVIAASGGFPAYVRFGNDGSTDWAATSTVRGLIVGG